MSERDERLAVRGPRGPQGNQGNRGEQGSKGDRGEGMSRSVRRAVVALFVLSGLLAAASLLWSAHQQNDYEASLSRDHATHLRQDEMLVDHLCLTFGKLGALKPPAGNPATNPARAYDQELHSTLVQLGDDLGCNG